MFLGMRQGLHYGIFQEGSSHNEDLRNYFQNNVGIGITAPKYSLDVAGSIACTKNYILDGGIDTTNGLFT